MIEHYEDLPDNIREMADAMTFVEDDGYREVQQFVRQLFVDAYNFGLQRGRDEALREMN